MAAGQNNGAWRANTWKRIAEAIRRDIVSGVLAPHDRLKSERALAADHHAGVRAVRLAVQSLKTEGVLYSRPRSGVFVADSTTAAPEAATPGLHAMDLVYRGVCRLRFLILGWNAGNKADWEELCRNVTRAHPHLAVQPLFPASERDNAYWRRHADVFVVSALDSILSGSSPLIERLSRSEAAAFPLSERYRRVVEREDGLAGIPISGTLLTGGINPAVPPETRRALSGARSWEEALELLAGVHAAQPELTGLNFHSGRTLNLHQHLLHAGGRLVDPVSRRLRIGEPVFRRALEALESSRGRAYPAYDPQAPMPDPESCAVYLDWTFSFPRKSALLRFEPWLFPLGPGGACMEGVNIGVISGTTPYPEECRRFLRYLLSDPAQRMLTRAPGEHPVSVDAVDPFAAYEPGWKRVLTATLERSEPGYEYTPGYAEFLETIMYPLAHRFCAGEYDAGGWIAELEERGNRLFEREEMVVEAK